MARRIAAMLATCALAAAPAAAHASDASVTESYLRANLALVTAGHDHLGASVAGYHSVLAHVRSSCPKIAASSPQDPESTQLTDEVIGAMVLASAKPDLGAIGAYLRAVRGMRWSSASVTHAVSSYASMLRRTYKLSPPNLCGDVGSWTTSGFKTLPSTTVGFVKVFLPNWVALGLVPPGIGRFESGPARGLAGRAERYERQLTDAEAQAVETWGSIMDTLELNP
ncbi:MAG: hypothetical protein ACYDC2_00415 [Solirubrobacteraceae bacterium]